MAKGTIAKDLVEKKIISAFGADLLSGKFCTTLAIYFAATSERPLLL